MRVFFEGDDMCLFEPGDLFWSTDIEFKVIFGPSQPDSNSHICGEGHVDSQNLQFFLFAFFLLHCFVHVVPKFFIFIIDNRFPLKNCLLILDIFADGILSENELFVNFFEVVAASLEIFCSVDEDSLDIFLVDDLIGKFRFFPYGIDLSLLLGDTIKRLL